MIGTILAIVSLGFSLFLFFRFDARIKEQEKLLNDYKIKEYKEAERNQYDLGSDWEMGKWVYDFLNAVRAREFSFSRYIGGEFYDVAS